MLTQPEDVQKIIAHQLQAVNWATSRTLNYLKAQRVAKSAASQIAEAEREEEQAIADDHIYGEVHDQERQEWEKLQAAHQ